MYEKKKGAQIWVVFFLGKKKPEKKEKKEKSTSPLFFFSRGKEKKEYLIGHNNREVAALESSSSSSLQGRGGEEEEGGEERRGRKARGREEESASFNLALGPRRRFRRSPGRRRRLPQRRRPASEEEEGEGEGTSRLLPQPASRPSRPRRSAVLAAAGATLSRLPLRATGGTKSRSAGAARRRRRQCALEAAGEVASADGQRGPRARAREVRGAARRDRPVVAPVEDAVRVGGHSGGGGDAVSSDRCRRRRSRGSSSCSSAAARDALGDRERRRASREASSGAAYRDLSRSGNQQPRYRGELGRCRSARVLPQVDRRPLRKSRPPFLDGNDGDQPAVADLDHVVVRVVEEDLRDQHPALDDRLANPCDAQLVQLLLHRVEVVGLEGQVVPSRVDLARPLHGLTLDQMDPEAVAEEPAPVKVERRQPLDLREAQHVAVETGRGPDVQHAERDVLQPANWQWAPRRRRAHDCSL